MCYGADRSPGCGSASFLLNTGAMAAPEGSRFNAEYFTNLPLVTHEGKTVRFYDDLIKDKLVVINFAISPATTSARCPRRGWRR